MTKILTRIIKHSYTNNEVLELEGVVLSFLCPDDDDEDDDFAAEDEDDDDYTQFIV